jgi:hypothetical protein
MFTINEAFWDRLLRVAVGVAMLYLGWSGIVTGGLGVLLKYFGFVPVVTGAIGWCPLYSVFGVCTRKTTA